MTGRAARHPRADQRESASTRPPGTRNPHPTRDLVHLPRSVRCCPAARRARESYVRSDRVEGCADGAHREHDLDLLPNQAVEHSRVVSAPRRAGGHGRKRPEPLATDRRAEDDPKAVLWARRGWRHTTRPAKRAEAGGSRRRHRRTNADRDALAKLWELDLPPPGTREMEPAPKLVPSCPANAYAGGVPGRRKGFHAKRVGARCVWLPEPAA